MDVYIKEFDRWNEQKKQVDAKSKENPLYINEREVWWCSMGVNVGSEIDGKNENFERPVLVVKRFNKSMFWGVPLTSKAKENPYIVMVNHEKGVSYANVSQLRLLSSNRMLRKVGMISQEDFQSILKCIKNAL